MKTMICFLSCLVLLPPVRGEEQSSKELLRDGLFEEEVNQDFQKASSAYQKVTKRYDEERYFAGLAFFRLAEIARKSGNRDQAAALYRRIAGEFGDQKEIAGRAVKQLGEAGMELRKMTSANPSNIPQSDAEALELQRLQKMERDSPDLLNGVGEDGWHPIHKAAANGWTNAVDFLLKRKVKVDPRAAIKAKYHSDGYTPLHLAVIHGHLTVVDQLLAAKADPGLVVGIKPIDLPLPVQSNSIPLDSRGEWSSLHLSILFQRREIMSHLLEAKAPLVAGGPPMDTYETTFTSRGGGRSTNSWNFSATPLILAVWLNDMVAFQTLIDHGADINQASSEDGETPLLAAIWKNSLVIPTLFDQGARVTDLFTFGRTSLHWAIVRCQPPTILRLIKEGADVNIRVKIDQYSSEGHPSPLEAVMAGGNFEEGQRDKLCNALLKAGAQPTPRVLVSATAYGQFQLVKAFIKAGVDPNGTSSRGDRPLHFVKHVEAARILIESGAQMEVKNHEGITPFGRIVQQEDTPQSRALIDYLLERGADDSVVPSLLFSNDLSFGESPLLPYVMSKTFLAGKSNPKAIMLAFPENWQVMVGEDLVLADTPAPTLHELLCLNYQTLASIPTRTSRTGSRTGSAVSRSSTTRVVTDLVIYRPNEKGELIELIQLADQEESVRKNTPALQWGDVVLFRMGPKRNDKQLMPLVHYVSEVPSRTVTFKVGPWEHKVEIDNTHLALPGLELKNHFSDQVEFLDLTAVVLRRANGESKTINLTQTHDPKKFRLRDGDVIEYSMKKPAPNVPDAISPPPNTHIFFPDRPSASRTYARGNMVTLWDHLYYGSLPRGRDFSKLEIRRQGKNGLERIPLDLLAMSQSLANGGDAMAKAVELLKTTVNAGDILVFPPIGKISWEKRNSYTSASEDSGIEPLIKLIKPKPTPRPTAPPRAAPSKKATSRTSARPRVLPPSR